MIVDGSTHEWVPGKKWDLIVTMDDATNEHYSIFFVQEEGTASSFQGVHGVILQRGLFSSLYIDRHSTPSLCNLLPIKTLCFMALPGQQKADNSFATKPDISIC
jgi:hypothetical protein